MFSRIVKMEFREAEVVHFLQNFQKHKDQIRAFPGCTLLELYQDREDPTVFFTYSRWDSPQDLENYRQSELFKGVWATTRALFRSKARAWSVDTLHRLP